jgi:hypothetical protein
MKECENIVALAEELGIQRERYVIRILLGV